MSNVNNVFYVIIGKTHGLLYILLDANNCLINVGNNRKTLAYHEYNYYGDKDFRLSMIIIYNVGCMVWIIQNRF